MNTSMKVAAPMAFAFVLSACGGGSSSSSGGVDSIEYAGSTTAASLSSANQQEFADSATDVVAKAIAADDSSDALEELPFGGVISSAEGEQRELAKQAVQAVLDDALAGVPVAASQTVEGDCGGTAKASGSEDSFTITYSNFCMDIGYGYGQMVTSGTVYFDFSTSGNIETTEIEYRNFSMSYDGESYTLNGTMVDREHAVEYYTVSSTWNYTITEGGETYHFAGSMTCSAEYDCDYFDQVEGSDGSIYQVSDLDVYSTGSDYDVEATFYHPDYGYVELTASDITLCTDGSVGGGTILLVDKSNHGVLVQFNGCGVAPSVSYSNNVTLN